MNENTKTCTNCGKEMRPDAKFCMFCGTANMSATVRPQPKFQPQILLNTQDAYIKQKKRYPKWPFVLGGSTMLVIITIVLVITFACFHTEWNPATCNTPENCADCGKTRGEKLEHSWIDATCKTPKTCKDCGKTEGGTTTHKWSEATCTSPKTCEVCNKTDGEALGHSVKEWKNVLKSTCTVKGKDEGVCIICNETITKELDLLSHTKGKWETTKTPTKSNSKGEKVLKCTVCKKTLKTKTYELSPKEIETEYKSNCQKYSYDIIARSPNRYKNKQAKFYGKVIQVMQEKVDGKIYYTLRIGTGGSYYYDNVIFASYSADENEPRILEDDMITIYGNLGGEYTYETVMGSEMTIPLIHIEYID